jgi:hypothetical protein
MVARSTLNRRATSLPEIDKFCAATRLVMLRTCDLNASGRPVRLLLFDVKIAARSGNDRRQIDTGRLYPHSVIIKLTNMFQGCLDECTASLKCVRHLQAESQPISLFDCAPPAG